MAKKYRVTLNVNSAVGTRTYLVDADSPEDAARLVNDGKAEFEYEEVEVQSLDRATADCVEEVE